jgi:hypothetical protein
VEISSVQEQDYEGDDRIGVIPLSPGSQVINIVKPEQQWCTCSLWQEFLYPCQHGCAVYRKCWEEKDLDYVLENVVHVFYRYDYVQKLFQNNVFPTCIDNATYDGETKPPRVTGRQGDRLAVRERKEFADEVSFWIPRNPQSLVRNVARKDTTKEHAKDKRTCNTFK